MEPVTRAKVNTLFNTKAPASRSYTDKQLTMGGKHIIDTGKTSDPDSENRQVNAPKASGTPVIIDYQAEGWVWSSEHKSSQVNLSGNKKTTYFHTDPVDGSISSSGVRGTKGFVDGEHYWEIKFAEAPSGSSIMIGVGTKDAVLHSEDSKVVNLIGKDAHSWGLSYKGSTWHNGKQQTFCQAFYKENTVIGVHLNLYMGTLTFYQDGQFLGVAFTGLNQVKEELYPIISSTATPAELEVGRCVCRYLSLQEKCFLKVFHQLQGNDDIQKLSLPHTFKEHLHAMVAT